MTLTTENLSTGRETCLSATLPTNLTWTEPGADDEPHEPWHGLLKDKIILHYILRPSPNRAVNTLVSFIKTSQLKLYREIIAVCSEIHTNALCGQNAEFLKVECGGTSSIGVLVTSVI